MSQSKENVIKTSQLNNKHYEHTLSVSSSVLSAVEFFTFAVLSSCLYYRNDILIPENFRIVGLVINLIVLARLLGRVFWGVKTESIYLIKALGLQTTTVYHSNFKSSKFIPWHSINDVVINEAIVMQKVIFYLAVLVKADNNPGGESIIPIFIHARPRLSELKKIYNSVQLILRN